MKKGRTKKILALTGYALAMGLLETAVVVYLRELYYPKNFLIKHLIDLVAMPVNVLKIELWREAATIIMLAAVGYLAFRHWILRIFAFLFVFSVWDLSYYLFLFIFIHWPPSLTTMYIYYLIPKPWMGPVWLPLLLFSIIGLYSFKKLMDINKS